MEQPTLPFPRISVSSQDRPTPDAHASWPMGFLSTACFRPFGNRPHLAIVHICAHDCTLRSPICFSFERVELLLSRVSRRRPIAFPRSGVGGFPNFSYTLRPCLSSVAQSCLNDAARLMIVAWSLHLPERPERWLCGNTDPMCHDQDSSQSLDEAETTSHDPAESHNNWDHKSRHVLDIPKKVGDANEEFQDLFRWAETTWCITSEKHLSICLYEIDRCWRPLAAGSSFFCRPRCCRRAHKSPHIRTLSFHTRPCFAKSTLPSARSLAVTT